jgi:hypothetical protein
LLISLQCQLATLLLLVLGLLVLWQEQSASISR